MKGRAIRFFKCPNAPFAACISAVGLMLIGLFIATVVLDLWSLAARLCIIVGAAAVTAYALYCIATVLDIPERLREAVSHSKTLSRFIDNYHFRTAAITCGSLLLDGAFAVTELASGVLSRSGWFIINGAYYLLLCVTKLCIILFGARPLHTKNMTDCERKKHGAKVYVATGIVLFVLNSVLTMLFDGIVAAGTRFAKHYLMIYVTAVYTFFRVALAIWGFIKTRKDGNLVTRALRDIGIVTASVSLLTFLTSIVATFPDTADLAVANGITAGYITLFTAVLAISMLITAFKHYKSSHGC